MSRVAMIAGATGGIGGAISKSLLAKGYRLSLGVRTPGKLGSLATVDGVKVFPYDAARRGSEKDWVAGTLEAFGHLDAVVNAAGILRSVTSENGAEDDLDAMFEINVKAPYRLIRAALPALRASGRGRVVNIASLSGKRVRNLNVGYQMSKFAMVALTHAVRRYGWDDGIRATAVCPGWVRTEMSSAAPPSQTMTEPDELAELIAAVLECSNTAAVAELLVNCEYEHTL